MRASHWVAWVGSPPTWPQIREPPHLWLEECPLKRDSAGCVTFTCDAIFGQGYVARFGELSGVPSAIAGGLSYLGVSVGTNAIGRSRATLSSRFTRFEDLVILPAPATIEVRVNGRTITSRVVGAGRLTIADVPVGPGANDVEIIVRHADGRVETFDRSIVGGIDLLGPGASELGMAVGWLGRRGGLGFAAPIRYADPFASLHVARGLNDAMTLRLNAEGRLGSESHAAARVEVAGRAPAGFIGRVGATWNVSRTGTAELLSVGSARGPARDALGGDTQGWESEAQLERSVGYARITLGVTRATETYLTMRQSGFSRDARWQGRADLTASWRDTSVGVRYRLREEWGADPTHNAAVTWAQRVGRGSLRSARRVRRQSGCTELERLHRAHARAGPCGCPRLRRRVRG